MKNGWLLVGPAALIAWVLTTLNSFPQGSLTPAGAPGPTMKTLQQVEPRTPIESLPYTITNSGSYYLTRNLDGGGSQNGIIIQADAVTIDLRGFGVANCITGIGSAAGIKGVAIHNGTVRGCTGTGIALGDATRVRLEDLTVSDNGGNGASVGAASILTLCMASGNAGDGLTAGAGSSVFHCIAQSNNNNGIVVSAQCRVAHNTCDRNGSAAPEAAIYATGDGNRIEGNNCNRNLAHGIKVGGAGNLVVQNSACGNGGTDYVIVNGNTYGQIVVAAGAGFVNSNPWANFSCGTQTPIACAQDADCDDANACTTDVCDAGTCSHSPIANCSVCGDGVVTGSEDCDDSNTTNGDGCSAICTIEPGFQCSGQPSVCMTVCGDGVPAGTEACDDNNAVNGDGCSATCTIEPGFECTGQPSVCTSTMVCGDGLVAGIEACDDGNTTGGDGCSSTCTVEPGFGCAGQPSTCFTVCGDGVEMGSEACDDNNAVNGDGCSATCTIEPGFQCTGQPSVCMTVCGDGVMAGVEACDDGNTTNGDGCSASCTVESGG
jgi:cysteine-rich repeat protein